ncbi:hypothetical protein JZ751_003651 [Albula glossodonta]|uniref:Uncharacterized protein n=1 Tax=Albula glossodonta TaxID=121402 RepID=A0A8T2N5Y5_9TELE|nr:hypothetical protein JZ751_003651 [Albula glossodonta]
MWHFLTSESGKDKTFNSTTKEERHELLKKLRAERSKVRQLEEKVKTVERNLAVLKTEKAQVELEAKVLQEELDKKGEIQNAPQQTAESLAFSERESKVRELLKSHKHKILEMEQDRKKAEDLLKMQTNTLVAEHALAAERKESADLRQKVIEVTTQLAEIQQPVFVPPPAKDGKTSGKSGKSALEGDATSYEEKLLMEEKNYKELEETIKKMEHDLSSLESEKSHLENLNRTLKEEGQILTLLCQQKDSALQQKLAEEEMEQSVKEIKAAGPKGEIKNFKQKIKEINEKNEKAQTALKNQIANAIKEEQSKCEETLRTSELKSQKLEEKIKTLKEDCDAQKNEKLKLQIQISSLQGKVNNLSELCERKDQVIQQKSAQVDSERRAKDLKVKEVLRSHKQKIQEIETEREKMALFYISEVKSGPAGRPLTANRKEVTSPQNKAEVSTPPAEQGSQEKLYLKKLQAEEKKTQELIETIRALQQDRDSVESEKSQLEHQAAALQGKLQNMSELCQLKEQALQQNVAQMESERRDNELKMKELLMSYKEDVQKIESENHKLELSYKAEMKACASDRVLKTREKEMANLRKQLDEVKAELADLQRPQSEPTPGCSYWPTTPGEKSQSLPFEAFTLSATDQLVNATEEERNLYLKKLKEEEKKTQELEGKILTQEQDRQALKNEKSHLEQETAALRAELDKMINLSQQQEKALQQKVMQVEAALLENKEEIQRVLQAQSLRSREMEEERERMQSAYLAQIETEEKQAKENLMKAESSEEALAAERKITANLQNQLDDISAKLARYQRAVSEPVPGPSDQETCPLWAEGPACPPLPADPAGLTRAVLWSVPPRDEGPFPLVARGQHEKTATLLGPGNSARLDFRASPWGLLDPRICLVFDPGGGA